MRITNEQGNIQAGWWLVTVAIVCLSLAGIAVILHRSQSSPNESSQPNVVRNSQPLQSNFSTETPAQSAKKFPPKSKRLDREDERFELESEMMRELEREREMERERYDKPSEAARYLTARRLPEGETELQIEPYLEAMEKARDLPQFSTLQNRLLPSRRAMAKHNASGSTEEQAALAAWTPLGPGNIGGRTRALLVNPRNPEIMYAAGVAGGVWKTTDGGRLWQPLTDFLPTLAVCALAFDPTNPDVIYAGTGEGYFNADATRGAGIFRSFDGGSTWRQLEGTRTANFHYVNDIVISRINPNRLYAATRFGVMRSLDGGGTWTLATSGISTGEVFTVVADPLNASRAYLGAQTGFYSTTNAGASWTLLNPQIPARAIAADPISSGVVYAGFERAVYISANGGTSFTRSDSGIDEADIRSIAIDPTNNAVVYVAGASRGVFRSSNSGASWSLAGPGTVLQSARVVAIDPLVSSNVYVGGELVDAFVAAVDTSGGSLIYSTFIGERGIDEGAAIVLDGNKAIIAGRTSSPALPMVGSGPDQTYAGGALDGFVIGLDSAGSSLTF